MSDPDQRPGWWTVAAADELLARMSAEHRAAHAAWLRAATAEAERVGKPPPHLARLREAFAGAPEGVLQWVPFGIWDDPAAATEWADDFYYRNTELRDTEDMIELLTALEVGRDWQPRPRPGAGA